MATITNQTIREWAIAQGFKVGVRGRLPQDIIDEYANSMGYSLGQDRGASQTSGYLCSVCEDKFRTVELFDEHRPVCRKTNGR